jgi:hypothetical protein
VEDPYELVYLEAVRALSHQRESIESLRTRAGIVLSGAAVASSLFGARAAASGEVGLFGWLAVASLAGLGLALLAVLWPHSEWQATPSPSRVIETAIEGPKPVSLRQIHRDLALHMEVAREENDALYERLARYFRLSAVLLSAELLAWIVDLATRA